MRLHPVAAALGRNRTGLLLVATQIALTLAIVCNSVFIIEQRLAAMGRPSGTDEANLFTFRMVPFKAGQSDFGQLQVDLDALRALPGVADATASNSAPLSGGGWSTGINRQPPDPAGRGQSDSETAVFVVDHHGIGTLGLQLVQGRNFTVDELVPVTANGAFEPTAVIVSQALADALFPDGDALGRQVYAFGQTPATIVGVVARLQAAWSGWPHVEHAVLAPGLITESRYIVRTEPGRRDAVMAQVDATLRALNDQRLVHQPQTFTELRQRSYRRDRAMAVMLVTVIACLVTVTALGIGGLASFWVTRRTRQIGTRRALGGRRSDILRYFQLENLVITALGLGIGAALTYGFNAWLMQQYELPRLAWHYVPLGALALLGLGQAAVLGPALRAASVPPAVATRTA